MPQSEIIFSVQESPEGGFQARALGFSIFTEADSLEELKSMIRDAVSCHFDGPDKPSAPPEPLKSKVPWENRQY